VVGNPEIIANKHHAVRCRTRKTIRDFGRGGCSVMTFAKLKPIPSGWAGKEWALLQFGLTAMVQRLKSITRFHGI
jgi:hypothetical protein